MQTIYLGLGTNLGDRAANLQAAIQGLAEKLVIAAVSPIYQTPPWGVTDQPDFLNLCLAAKTNLPPVELLTFVKNLEVELGRQPAKRWGPRLIDIDILFYANQLIETENMTIPHPRLAERAFVLRPLADIAPDFVHPALGETMADLAEKVGDVGIRPYPQTIALQPAS
ncbi:MAG: 2-amino-4-hydroxy-6-hydroxymethyldihydropteridine diphosphokinase [Anaerolineales bacterium]|nr:2-amino-4-hydroxy-6-hydroxymethyldihydropteridine diphosphokinase [Anaerolineales bacterium]MCB8937145.1 2-amino-4-hydroxy-6-hydroxymethyldihydropteridine diphosphokinase [Ardenticatenaceae bacterium]